MTTKAQRKAIIDEKVSAEKARILEIMRKSDLYTITLDPLLNHIWIFLKYTNINIYCGKKKVFQKLKNSRINQVLLINQNIR